MIECWKRKRLTCQVGNWDAASRGSVKITSIVILLDEDAVPARLTLVAAIRYGSFR